MNTYLVVVKAYAPYPIKADYRVEGSNFATAINRAVRRYRKDKVARRRINEIFAQATRL